jgi:putative ABC transport system permease protein
MGTLWQDVRYGLRMLGRSPGVTVVVVLILGLGIGATTAIFSVVNAVLLRPLPLPDPEQLVMIWEGDRKTPEDFGAVGLLRFLDWQSQCTTLAGMAFFELEDEKALLSDAGEAVQLVGGRVSPEYFSVLGVTPCLGRTFTAEEAREGGPPVVILSQETWQRCFASDPAILGKIITLDRKPRTIVGIIPAGFRFLAVADFWIPFPMDADSVAPVGPGTGRGAHGAYMVGRLKPQVTQAQVQAELEAIAGRRTVYPIFDRDRVVRFTSPRERIVKDARLLLCVFQAAALLVLLVGTANVANLLLVRSESRGREMALRAALGAGRRRIVRQLLTENLLLAALGGGLGLLVAYWGSLSLSKLAASFLPRMEEVSVDGRVLGFACLLSLASGLAFGLVPAVRSMKADLNECLKESGAVRSCTGSHHPLTRRLLVVAEIALSLVLLIGAGLFLKSFVLLNRVRLGFNPWNVLVVKVAGLDALDPPAGPGLLESLSSLPSVQAVGAVTHLPPCKGGRWDDVQIEGEPTTCRVLYQAATPDYFRAMGIAMVKGRGITEQDIAGASLVAVVNETFVNRHLHGTDPIGKLLVDDDARYTVVGVVKDVLNQTLLQKVYPEVYYSHRQAAFWNGGLVLRTQSDPMRLTAPVRQAVRATLGEDSVVLFETMEGRLAGSIMPQRFQTALVALFSAVGLALAAIGIYGVISYSVAQRIREFGVRIAVGAQRTDILQLVVRQALWLVAVGLALGLLGAVVLTRVLKTFLFEVEPLDPLTFLCVSAFLAVVALLASYVPARRAARIDPMVALRYE